MITLGSKVRDRVSGMEGVVIGRCEYLYCTPQVYVARCHLDDGGKLFEKIWMEEAQMEVVEDGNKSAFGFQPKVFMNGHDSKSH